MKTKTVIEKPVEHRNNIWVYISRMTNESHFKQL